MAFLIGGANSAADDAYALANSLRFNQVDSPKLSWTPASDANRQIMTWSFWLKRSTIINDVNGSYQFIMGLDDEGVGYNPVIRLNNDAPGDTIRVSFLSGMGLTTDRSYRDVSAWYHVVLAFDSTQAVAANRIKIYTNGVQETTLSASAYGSQNDIAMWGKAGRSFDIGWMDIVSEWATAKFLDGYLADFYYINEQQLTPTDFGEFDEDSGIWKPKEYTGSYNSYSWFLEFKQTGTDADASGIGADTSGQDNHFTSTNLAATDITTDTPTNNFCTLNAINPTETNASFAEGNLKFTNTLNSSPHHGLANGTMAVANGKWYWEVRVDAIGGTAMSIGAQEVSEFAKNDFTGNKGIGFFNNGNFHYRGTESSDPGTYTTDDIIGVALDMDNRKIWFHKNGTYEDSGDPTSGATGTGAVSLNALDVTMVPAVSKYNSGICNVNFGNPAWAVSSSQADDDGYGNFEYDVPTGFYALCTKNLAEYG